MCKSTAAEPAVRPAVEAEGAAGAESKRPPSLLDSLESRLHFQTKILWTNVLLLALMHLLVPWAFIVYGFPVGWKTVLFNLAMYVMGSFGVSGGVHRYWSHRSFGATWPLRLVLMLCFAASAQKTIYAWVRDHRVHHKYVDTDADPHNINRGFFFAHIGWNLMKKHPEVIRRGRQVDMSDITSDPIASFYDRHSYMMQLVCSFIVPTCVPILLWREDWACALSWRWVCYFAGIHSTWSINSFAHAFGSRPFNGSIKPTDNRLLAFFLADEGFHNYHHTFPWDYSTSELGYLVSVSITTPLLDGFRRLGWAHGLKQPSPRLVAAVAARRGDGTRSPIVTAQDAVSPAAHHHHHHDEVPEDYELSAAEMDADYNKLL